MEIGVCLKTILKRCFLSDLKSHEENIRTSALISRQAVTPGSRRGYFFVYSRTTYIGQEAYIPSWFKIS
jgi:hypothetical protein